MWKGSHNAAVVEGVGGYITAPVGYITAPRRIDYVEFDLDFDPIAKGFAASFFVTLLLSCVATFAATDFNPETDKIIRYYGFFNPCLLFDHFPAKALAMAGMGIFVVLGILFSFIFFVYVYMERRLATTVWTGTVVVLVTCAQLIFVNVFTVNLYPEKVPDRRLHGLHADVDGTVSLLEQAAPYPTMPAADIASVELHTAFYIVWLLAELLFMVHVASKFFQKEVRKWRMWMHVWICLYGAGFHALAMLVMILQNRPKVDWYFRAGGLSSQVQWVIIWIDAKTFTSLWGWLPIMFYRYLFTTGHGLRFTFSLERMEDDSGRVQPGLWFGRSLRAFALILGVGGIFTTNWMYDHTTLFKLAAPFRSKPFGYFAAPATLAAVIYLGLSVSLTVIQQRLLDGWITWPLVWIGMALVFCFYSCLLVVLEEERFTAYFFMAACVFLSAWLMLLTRMRGQWQRGFVYVVVGWITLGSAILANRWPVYYLVLLWLAIGEHIVLHQSEMYLKVQRIADDSYHMLGDLPGASEVPGSPMRSAMPALHGPGFAAPPGPVMVTSPNPCCA